MLAEAKNLLAIPSPISIQRAVDGGWAIFDHSGDEPSLLHCCGGGEGLLEYFADALSLSAPTLPGPPPQPRADEAPAAAIVPLPVSAEVADRLAPVVRIARGLPEKSNSGHLVYEFSDVFRDIVTLTMGDLRAVIEAAGLFTDDMRPSQHPETPAADASVKPAEAAGTPPQAIALDEGDSDGDDGDTC